MTLDATATTTTDEADLLRRYVHQGVEEAFAALVDRYVSLVHSAALRQTNGNAATAADLTQLVFTELAGQSRRLIHHPSLAGWLYMPPTTAALSLTLGSNAIATAPRCPFRHRNVHRPGHGRHLRHHAGNAFLPNDHHHEQT